MTSPRVSVRQNRSTREWMFHCGLCGRLGAGYSTWEHALYLAGHHDDPRDYVFGGYAAGEVLPDPDEVREAMCV